MMYALLRDTLFEGKVTTVFVVAEDYYDWQHNAKKTGYDFTAKVMVDVTEALVTSAVASFIVSAACSIYVGTALVAGTATTVALPVIAVGAAVVLVGIGLNLGIKAMNNKYHFEEAIESWISNGLKNAMDDLNKIVEKLEKEYSDLATSLFYGVNCFAIPYN